MILTNYNETPVYLVTEAPDWETEVEVDFAAVADLTGGLSGREARRDYGGSLRVEKLSYKSTLSGQAARAVDDALRDYQLQAAAVPFWPGMSTWGERAGMGITGGLMVVWKADWSEYTIYAWGGEPVWPGAGDWVAPLLWGHLEARSMDWASGDIGVWSVNFEEHSPAAYALRLPMVDWESGPAPSLAYAGAGPDLFPYAVDWDNPTLSFEVSIIRETLGFGREPLEYVYPQTNARADDQHYTLTSPGASELLSFFLDHTTASFWVPRWIAAVVLTAPVGPGDTVLHVDGTAGIRAGDWIAFTAGGIEGVLATARVTVLGEGTITVDAAPGALTTETQVSLLTLCRMEKTKLAVNWHAPDLAVLQFPVREVPPEYAPAAGETLGTTIGRLPPRCYLYEFSRQLGVTAVTDRLTSYEADITYLGNVYTSSKITHGEIRQGLMLDADEVDLHSDIVAGAAMVQLATLGMEAPLMVRIIQVDVAGTNAAVLFVGEVTKASVKGPRISAKACTAGTLFDRRVPRMLVQLGCNHALFSPGCRVAQGAYSFGAVVAAGNTAGYPFAIGLNTFTRPAVVYPAIGLNVFAGGTIWKIGGAVWERFLITASTVVGAGTADLVVSAASNAFGIGQQVGMLTADGLWTLTGQVEAISGWPTIEVMDVAFAAPIVPACPANWFAGGWVEFGAGATFQRRGILQSTALAAGALSVTVDRDPNPYPVAGDHVVLYPGCDQTVTTCQSKFGNFLNFGGHPFLPIANPSVIVQPATGSGKKG